MTRTMWNHHSLMTIFSTFFFTIKLHCSLKAKLMRVVALIFFSDFFSQTLLFVCMPQRQLEYHCCLYDFTTERRLKPSLKSMVSFIQFFFLSSTSRTEPSQAKRLVVVVNNWEISQTFASKTASSTVRNEASDERERSHQRDKSGHVYARKECCECDKTCELLKRKLIFSKLFPVCALNPSRLSAQSPFPSSRSFLCFFFFSKSMSAQHTCCSCFVGIWRSRACDITYLGHFHFPL